MGSRGWNGATVVLTPVLKTHSRHRKCRQEARVLQGFSIGGETYRLAAMGAEGYAFDYWLAEGKF